MIRGIKKSIACNSALFLQKHCPSPEKGVAPPSLRESFGALPSPAKLCDRESPSFLRESVDCQRAAMDHSVKAMHSHRKVVFSRLLNRHNFENRELEQLYRRYTVKLQQTSTSSVLVLTALLALSLAGLHVAYARFLTAAAIFYILILITFGGSLILMQTGHVKDAHLPTLCYGVLVLSSGLCIVGLPVQVSESNTWGAGSWGQEHAAVHGAWEVLFVLFVAYSLLPLKTRIAVCVGILLPALHTIVAISSINSYQETAWQQVSSFLN